MGKGDKIVAQQHCLSRAASSRQAGGRNVVAQHAAWVRNSCRHSASRGHRSLSFARGGNKKLCCTTASQRNRCCQGAQRGERKRSDGNPIYRRLRERPTCKEEGGLIHKQASAVPTERERKKGRQQTNRHVTRSALRAVPPVLPLFRRLPSPGGRRRASRRAWTANRAINRARVPNDAPLGSHKSVRLGKGRRNRNKMPALAWWSRGRR